MTMGMVVWFIVLIVLALLGFIILFIIYPEFILRLRFALKFLFFGGYRKGFSNGWKHVGISEGLGYNVLKLFNDFKYIYAPDKEGKFSLFRLLSTFMSYMVVRLFLLLVWIVIPITFVYFVVVLPFSGIISAVYGMLVFLLLTLVYFLFQASFSDDIFEELRVGNPLSPYKFFYENIRSSLKSGGNFYKRLFMFVINDMRRLIK